MNGDDSRDEDVQEIHISVEMERQAAEAIQLEATRLLTRHGLRVRAVTVTRASTPVTGADSAEAT